MGAKAVLPRHRRHRVQPVERPHRAPPEVRGLLHPEQPAPRHVPVGGADGRLHRGRLELSARPLERAGVDAGQGGRAPRLVVERMSGGVRQHFIPRTAVDLEGDFVAHGPRGEEHGRLLAQQLGHPLDEQVDRGVLESLLVPHLGGAHEAPHLRRRTRGRIAIEVDEDRGPGRHALS